MSPLDGIWAKLDRAEEQLNALEGELRAYIDSRPYRFTEQAEIQADGTQMFRYRDVKEPDLRLGVILGEIVHDLRSSLDHLVQELVLLSRKKPYSGNQFPIYDRELPDPANPKRRNWADNSPKDLQGVRPKYRAIIQEAQPYHRHHRARYHPLFVLNELWNSDKHNIVHGVALIPPEGHYPPRITFEAFGYSGFRATLSFDRRVVEEDAPALAFRFTDTPYGTPREVKVGGQFPIDVRFGERRISLPDLHRIGGFIVKRIIKRVAPLFRDTRRDHPLVSPKTESSWTLRVPNGQEAFFVAPPQNSPARFGDWAVWFDAGQVWDIPPAGPTLLPPGWWFRPPARGTKQFLSATAFSTVEDFRRKLEENFPADLVEQIFEYFEPEARQSPRGFGVFPT